MNVAAAAAEIVAALEAGGVRAVLDAADANPPCVQLPPPTIHFRFGRCQSFDWAARLLLPDNGQRNALAAAGELLELIQAALGGAVVTATATDFLLVDGSTVPGYTLTWTSRP